MYELCIEQQCPYHLARRHVCQHLREDRLVAGNGHVVEGRLLRLGENREMSNKHIQLQPRPSYLTILIKPALFRSNLGQPDPQGNLGPNTVKQAMFLKYTHCNPTPGGQ